MPPSAPANTANPSRRIVTQRILTEMYGFPKSSVRYWRIHNSFPNPKKLGARKVGWLLTDVEAWIASRPTPKLSA